MSEHSASEKRLLKAKKALDKDTVQNMEAMASEQLEKTIVEAEVGMNTAKEELEINSHYVAASAILKDLKGGLKDVNKRQTAKITLALHLLEAKGKI